MAKEIEYSKLKAEMEKGVITIYFNEQEIEVKNYLPVEEKLALISTIVNSCVEEARFYNRGKLDVYLTLGIIFNYTNISFTDEELKNTVKLYNELVSTGLYNRVKELLKSNGEYQWIEEVTLDTIENIYKYYNSAYGIMQSISEDGTNVQDNAEEIYNKIADKENLGLLREVISKLG